MGIRSVCSVALFSSLCRVTQTDTPVPGSIREIRTLPRVGQGSAAQKPAQVLEAALSCSSCSLLFPPSPADCTAELWKAAACPFREELPPPRATTLAKRASSGAGSGISVPLNSQGRSLKSAQSSHVQVGSVVQNPHNRAET